MSKLDPHHHSQNTLAIRAGRHESLQGENSEPISLTSSFVFKNAAEAAARFAGDEPGNIYSRFTNPTVQTFEERLAGMEGGERCIATSSGMSAILSTCLGLLEAGDHIVSSGSIFGTTINLFNNIFSRFGVKTDLVALDDYAAWEAAIRPETKIFFLETPSNPLTEIADISRLADLAHNNNCLLIVDNCFCTPILQKPLSHGADIIIHSATKYLDGQGRCVGGAVIGPEELLEENIFAVLRSAGTSMSPFNAWVFLKGLETLSIRMKAHCDNAENMARWLITQPGIEKVYFPGLADHPQHELAKTQQTGFGGIVSFKIKGGREAAWRFIDSTTLYSITANLGDTKSTLTHPATTTHGRMSEEQRLEFGICEGLVRLSVGLEDVDDLMTDFDQALQKASS